MFRKLKDIIDTKNQLFNYLVVVTLLRIKNNIQHKTSDNKKQKIFANEIAHISKWIPKFC